MTNQVNQAFEKWWYGTIANLILCSRDSAEVGYQAATQASESEINSLKEQVKELQSHLSSQVIEITQNDVTLESYAHKVAELQSDNNKLREALERLDGWLEVRHLGGLMPNEKELLKTTTAQSLAEHGNEVIERRG